MMANSPVKDCLDDGKEQKIIPVRALCIGSHCRQRAVKSDSDENENRKPTDGNNPADGKVSLQEVLTFRTAVLTVNVDAADYRKQDAPNCCEAICIMTAFPTATIERPNVEGRSDSSRCQGLVPLASS